MIRSIQKNDRCHDFDVVESEFKDVVRDIRGLLSSIPYVIDADDNNEENEEEVEEDYGE